MRQPMDTGLAWPWVRRCRALGRRNGHRSDTGGGGPWLGSRKVHPEANNSKSPSPAREEMPLGCKGQGSGPEGCHKWDQNPWPSQSTSYGPWLQTPGAGGQVELCWFRPPAAGCAWPQHCPSGSITYYGSQEPCRPCCPARERAGGRGTAAGGSRVHFNR